MRPEKISKLAMFAQVNEPLVYLFIINSDFILDDECKFLPQYALAGVMVKNKRILFFYKSEILELDRETLFFVILHEAFHIFKKHLERHGDLIKENPIILNMAQDTVINEEIADWPVSNTKTDIKPKLLENIMRAEKEFFDLHQKLGKEALTTRRVYDYLINKKIKKEDLLKPGSFARIKGTETYGKIDSINKDGTYRVEEMSKEDFEKAVNGGKSKTQHSKGNYTSDELIPVVRGGSYSNGVEVDFEVEAIDSFDVHFKQEEIDDIEQEVLAKKMFEQAKEMERQTKHTAGNTAGNFSKIIEELYKPKVNWKKELHKNLNLFYSNDCKTKTRRKSFITYPWNPKSRYGILCKHTIEETSNRQKYVIVATDTSGSVFYDKHEMQNFFTEIEAISKWFEFTKEGIILSVQWDAEIAEGLKKYKKGDWKKFQVKGGGGTVPHSVFNYLTKIYTKKNNHYIINENGVRFAIEDPKKLPFVVVLTDGIFFNKLEKSNLGVYENCLDNVLFFTKSDNWLDKDLKRIVYEGN